MANAKVFFGIDLGTSNSRIVYAVDDPRFAASPIRPTKDVLIPMGEDSDRVSGRLPSVVYYKGPRSISTGFPALEARDNGQGERGRDLFFSTKSDMGTNLAYHEAVTPDLNTPPTVAARILERLIRAALDQSGVDPRQTPTVVTVPASFDTAQRADTVEAARLAGLNLGEGDLLDEPTAAFLGFVNSPDFGRLALVPAKPKNLLVFDYGGGTCDVSILAVALDPEADPLGLWVANLAISNYEQLGGDRIDRLLAEEHLLPTVLEESSVELQNFTPDKREIFVELNLRRARRLKEKLSAQITKRVGHLPDLVWENLAKDLPTERVKTIRVNLGDDCTLAPGWVSLDPEQLAALTASLFSLESVTRTEDGYTCDEGQLAAPILSALNKADLQFEDIDYVLMTGSSCRLPLVWRFLAQLFSPSKILPVDEFDFAVARGAAFHSLFRHTKGRPILSPVAVDELGIVTFGVQPYRLVPHGKPLPFPIDGGYHTVEDKFCLPADGMERVRVSLYAGREGSRRIVRNYELPLPPETHKGETVVVQVRIDENKLTHLRAFLASNPDELIETEQGTLWGDHVPDRNEIPLIKARQVVRALCEEGRRVPPDDLISLAVCEHRNGHTERAIRILKSVIVASPSLAVAHNALGLCYMGRGYWTEAVSALRRAVDHDSRNPIYLGNLGSALAELKSWTEAEGALRLAVDVDPDEEYGYRLLGGLYRRMGNEVRAKQEWSQAEKRLRASLAQTPGAVWALNALAEVLRAQGKYPEAEETERELHRIDQEVIFEGSPEELLAGPSSGIWRLDPSEGAS